MTWLCFAFKYEGVMILKHTILENILLIFPSVFQMVNLKCLKSRCTSNRSHFKYTTLLTITKAVDINISPPSLLFSVRAWGMLFQKDPGNI